VISPASDNSVIKSHRLALFDLDNTLLRGDSESEWGGYLIDIGILEEQDYRSRHAVFCRQYDQGKLNVEELLRFQLEVLTSYPLAQLERWRDIYLQERVAPLLLEEGKEKIKAHQHRGDEVVIITATNEFLTRPIAATLGVSELIASRLEQDMDGNYTGRPLGTLSYGPGKIVRLHEWLADRGVELRDYEEVWFYSDSHNDLPLLKLVTHPVAIDPDPKLREHAVKEGWPIMSWR
jgi:HAD superfamily hydrolase (TIGR01490 family)